MLQCLSSGFNEPLDCIVKVTSKMKAAVHVKLSFLIVGHLCGYFELSILVRYHAMVVTRSAYELFHR